jgi:hypothetical protein
MIWGGDGRDDAAGLPGISTSGFLVAPGWGWVVS